METAPGGDATDAPRIEEPDIKRVNGGLVELDLACGGIWRSRGDSKG